MISMSKYRQQLAKFLGSTLLGRVIVLCVWATIPLLFSYGIWAKEIRNSDDRSIVTQIQTILSLDGDFDGVIDGICSQNLKSMIASRTGKTVNEKAIAYFADCSASDLAELKKKYFEKLVDKPSNKLNDEKIKQITTAIQKVSSAIPDQLEQQFRSLATIGMSAMVSALSIIMAGVAFLGNVFIKDQVRLAHEKEVNDTKNKLEAMLDVARSQISSHTFTTIGSYCTNLYIPLKEPNGKHKYLYDTYVRFAASMSELAYRSSEQLKKQSMENKDITLTPHQSGLIERCLNNYAYFLAEKSALSSNKDADIDRVQLGKILIDLKNLENAGTVELHHWNLKDTILWVKLHIGGNERDGVEKLLNDIISDSKIPLEWRKVAKTRYENHKRNNPALWSGAGNVINFGEGI